MNAIVYLARTLSSTRAFGRYFAPNPTVDLYFRNAMAARIQRPGGGERPIRAAGPSLFVCGRRAVVIRTASDRDLAVLRRMKPERVFYVLDDLLIRDDDDQGLPADYAARCRIFARERVPRILEHATELVTPSARIADQLPGLDSSLINPVPSTVCRRFDHFDAVASPLRVLFSGTRSHLGDLRAIAPELRRLLRDAPGVELTTFLGAHAPEELEGLSNVHHRRPLPWVLYKRVLERERFHIAISPTRDTAFNRARSASKILDHAALGAASIFSDHEPFRQLTVHGEHALRCESPAEWAAAIDSLRRDPEKLRSLAVAGAALARRLGDPDLQRGFWSERLDLGSS